jgi:hypothetical protein
MIFTLARGIHRFGDVFFPALGIHNLPLEFADLETESNLFLPFSNISTCLVTAGEPTPLSVITMTASKGPSMKLTEMKLNS